jgi:hypothetical protein
MERRAGKDAGTVESRPRLAVGTEEQIEYRWEDCTLATGEDTTIFPKKQGPAGIAGLLKHV